MKNKTIYWIVGIVLVIWYLRCNFNIGGGTPKSCSRKRIPQGEGMEDRYGEYEWNNCHIWRVLGLACRKQKGVEISN